MQRNAHTDSVSNANILLRQTSQRNRKKNYSRFNFKSAMNDDYDDYDYFFFIVYIELAQIFVAPLKYTVAARTHRH